MHTMRAVLIAFLIALLPVRAWLGDAMALAMAVAPAHGTAQLVAHPDHMAQTAAPCHGNAHSDHNDHSADMTAAAASAHAHAHAADGTDPGGHDQHCHTLCDLCNGPAMAATLPLLTTGADAPRLIPPAHERFASQSARRDVRPPIA
jgi:hypothetical protein